jgi:hypothetical protein
MREGLTARPLAVAVGDGVSYNRQAHVLQRHRGALCIWGADQYWCDRGRQEQAGVKGGLGKGCQERRWVRGEGHGTVSKPACRHWVAMHCQHVLNSSTASCSSSSAVAETNPALSYGVPLPADISSHSGRVGGEAQGTGKSLLPEGGHLLLSCWSCVARHGWLNSVPCRLS